MRPAYDAVEKDYICSKCGEPWDRYGVRTATDMTQEEADRFMKGEGCPSCHFGQTRVMAIKRRYPFFSICARCSSAYDAKEWDHCPFCGFQPSG